MEQSPLVKQIKCQKHKFQDLDIIDLTESSQSGRMCLLCNQQNNISHDSYLVMSQLFQQQEGEVLNAYPPFKNRNIREIIQEYCNVKILKSDIDSFFYKLREDIEAAIQSAENKAKQQLIKNEEERNIFIQEFNKIQEINQLKKLIVEGSQEELKQFLQKKYKNSEENEKIIQEAINQIRQNISFVSIEKKQKEVNDLIKSLEQFSLFDNNYIQKKYINFIKSAFRNSNQFTTIKTQQSSLKFINSTSSEQNGQAYLNFIMDPKKEYSIKMHFQTPKKERSSFLFGIVDDKQKDTNWSFYASDLCFHNITEKFAINKYLKGSKISQQKIKNEIKILSSKYLQRKKFQRQHHFQVMNQLQNQMTRIEYYQIFNIDFLFQFITLETLLRLQKSQNRIYQNNKYSDEISILRDVHFFDLIVLMLIYNEFEIQIPFF